MEARAIPTSNVHSAASLATIIVACLPKDASPQLNSGLDAIAIAAHASILAVGFRLIGLGEDHRVEARSAPESIQRLPSEWNATNGSYAFRYKHDQSSMEFLIKVNRMGTKAIVMGMGLGDDKTFTAELKADEYISQGNLPATPVRESTPERDACKKVTDVFISDGRLCDLGSLMRVHIIQKLIPGLQKAGYEETREENAGSSRSFTGRGRDEPRHDPLRSEEDRPARPHPFNDPLAHPRLPGRPLPEPIPGFDDEFEALRPPRGGPGYGPRIGIGERDLYPAGLGPNDPIRGGVGPDFGPIGGGGMHPTFDDPLFAGQGQRGGGYDPRNPLGSRYDPVGPGMGGHPRGAGMGGRPPNPFGGFGDGDFI